MGLHQSTMNEAYEKFKENMSYNDFIDELTEKEKLAVLTGNLNYQVGNGGFELWHLNEYSEQGQELISVMKTHLKGAASKKVITIVDDFLSEIDYLEDQGEDEEDFDSRQSDKQYDLVEKDFLKEVEDALKKM